MSSAGNRRGFRLYPEESAGDGIDRVTREQLDAIASCLPAIDDDVEAVHRIRVSCKRLRAIASLLAELDADLAATLEQAARDIGTSLSSQRDSDVIEQQLQRLLGTPDSPLQVSGKLLPASSSSTQHARTEAVSSRIAHIRSVLDLVEPDTIRYSALKRRFKKLRRKLQRHWRDIDAASTPAQWHALRKRLKTHLYQSQLLRKRLRSVGGKRIRRLKRLGEQLGELHDLSMLRNATGTGVPGVSPQDAARLPALMAARRGKLLKKCLRRGDRLLR